jgi:hypothetical protein
MLADSARQACHVVDSGATQLFIVLSRASYGGGTGLSRQARRRDKHVSFFGFFNFLFV